MGSLGSLFYGLLLPVLLLPWLLHHGCCFCGFSSHGFCSLADGPAAATTVATALYGGYSRDCYILRSCYVTAAAVGLPWLLLLRLLLLRLLLL
jgi:hypothetical protein